MDGPSPQPTRIRNEHKEHKEIIPTRLVEEVIAISDDDSERELPIFDTQDGGQNCTQGALGSENDPIDAENSTEEPPFEENDDYAMTNLTETSGADNVNDTITAYETAQDEMESSEVNKSMEDTMDSSVVNQSMDVSVGEEIFENAETETVNELIKEGEEGSHDSSLDEMHLEQEESCLDQEQDETSLDEEHEETSLEEFDVTPDDDVTPDETGLDLSLTGSDTNMESEGDETGGGYDAEDENTLEEILGSEENSLEQPEGGEGKSDDEMEGVNETSQAENSEEVDGNSFPVEALDDSSIQSSIDELNREKEKDPESSKHLSVKVDSGNQVVISVDEFLDLHDPPLNMLKVNEDSDSELEYNTCDDDDLDNLDSTAEVTVSDSCTSIASLNEKDIEDHNAVAKMMRDMVHELAMKAVKKFEKEKVESAKEKARTVRLKKASRKTQAQRRSGKQVKSKVKVEETEEIEFLDDGATPLLPGKKPNSSPKSSPAANKPEESYSPDTKKLRDECASRPSKVMVFRVYIM